MSAQPVSVRFATETDEKALLDILRAAYAENAIFRMNDSKVLEMIRHGTRGQGGIIGVIEGHGEIAASVGLTLCQFWYSDDWHLSERWNFVREPYRHSKYAQDLIEFSKWTADSMNLPLEMGVMSTKRTEAKVRLYQRKMKMIGAFFMHGIERAPGPLGVEAGVNNGQQI